MGPEFTAGLAHQLASSGDLVDKQWFSVAADGNRFLAVRRNPPGQPLAKVTLIQNWAKAARQACTAPAVRQAPASNSATRRAAFATIRSNSGRPRSGAMNGQNSA
jgi:hypothetical protein